MSRLSAEQAAHIRSGAGAAIAAVTMQLNGEGHRSLAPLRELNTEERIAANSTFVVLLAAVLTELSTLTDGEPAELLQRFAIGAARIEGDVRR